MLDPTQSVKGRTSAMQVSTLAYIKWQKANPEQPPSLFPGVGKHCKCVGDFIDEFFDDLIESTFRTGQHPYDLFRAHTEDEFFDWLFAQLDNPNHHYHLEGCPKCQNLFKGLHGIWGEMANFNCFND